jgi:FlaA1/EpsC-like NDP-sugar epimerase
MLDHQGTIETSMPRGDDKMNPRDVTRWLRAGFERLWRLIVPYRFWIVLCVHVFLFASSVVLSFHIHYHGRIEGAVREQLALALVVFLPVRLAVFWYYDLYQGLWRYVSMRDLLNIIRATTIGSLVTPFAGLAYKPLDLPPWIYILEWMFAVVLLGGVRTIVRHFRESRFAPQLAGGTARIVLVGPVDEVQPMVKELVSDPAARYNPICIVDPTLESSLALSRLCDIPILSIPRILSRRRRLNLKDVDAIVFCWHGAEREDLESAVRSLEVLGIPFKTVPSIGDILSGRVSVSDIRDVEIEDLLDRPPVEIEMDRIREYIQGKSVLVTGGGGSIGSELCRQVAALGPKSLVIVERSENSLYDFLLELRGNGNPAYDLHASISSVNDYPGLLALMREKAVDVVFHAAAYKHVPLMEPVPVESAYNNILGTWNAARASIDAGVSRFVMISTDKAVNPANVMGVTKRIAEMIVQSLNGLDSTRFMTVRFGNVLGSAGSVIPIFKQQLLNGGPLTVTHPEIERYFMTIPEAVQLILQAGCMGRGGEIFVLDMGKPVKILKLAEKLITLSGKRPYRDVDIRITGLRPGEKMYEELFNSGEELLETAHPRIRVAGCREVSREWVEGRIDGIRRLVAARDDAGLLATFKEMVPGYGGSPGVCAGFREAPGRGEVRAPAERPGRKLSAEPPAAVGPGGLPAAAKSS